MATHACIVAILLLSVAAAQPRAPLPQDTLPAGLPPARPPEGLPETYGDPKENPFTPARYTLGRKLFFDPILSADKTVACSSCHDPMHGFASVERFPLGVGGRRARRNAPTVQNRAFSTLQFWDGRALTLEDQVLRPIEDADEMGSTVDAALGRLRADVGYHKLFADAGLEPTRQELAFALALFVRRLTLGDSPVDRFRKGDVTALGNDERTGLWIYESKGRCWRCHSGPNFTDEGFHNTGVGVNAGTPEPGREAVTKEPQDRGCFKTPTLRGVAATGPYFHDGSADTLEAVIEFYRRQGQDNPQRDPIMREIQLDAEDVPRLVAFLRALSRPGAASVR